MRKVWTSPKDLEGGSKAEGLLLATSVENSNKKGLKMNKIKKPVGCPSLKGEGKS